MESRNACFCRTIGLLALALLMPVGIYVLFATPPAPEMIAIHPRQEFAASERLFTRGHIGSEPRTPGIITNVQVVDFDRNGRPDVLACDAQRGCVFWYRQLESGPWEEVRLNTDRLLGAPARATVVDLDHDGDLDVLVALLGRYMQTDEHVGKAVWLENDGHQHFTTRVILENVGRVTDIEAGDLDGDGDLDLAVAVFGHYRGKILWFENDGSQRFREHELLAVAGAIHVPIGDFDRDGDLDIAVLVSQDEEAVLAFENTGSAQFRPSRRELFRSSNFDLGTAGLFPSDLDADGNPDFLLVAGDNLDLHVNHPQPWHGCIWLKNLGGWKFEPRRLATFAGCYAAATGDIDGDQDLDVVLVSMFNQWDQEDSVSVIWLENDGHQEFKSWRIDTAPIQLATVACGDLNGDGQADIVAGSFHVIPPFDRTGRISTWLTQNRPLIPPNDRGQGPGT